jgi:orotidine-5'-phosphate decarboxylase
MLNTNNLPKIFCAVDKPDLVSAKKLCKQISSAGIGIKLGMEFFNALGPQGITDIHNAFPNTPIFIDLKYHDIPNTVAGAITSITAQVKPAYLNVHAAGGLEMMRAAKAACPAETKLIAVTILTSLDEEAITQVGYKDNLRERVVQMAKLTQEAGLDGVVCSSHEIEAIRDACGDDFALMVPGIRPEGSATGDQSRVMTPKQALDKGATHLVIGRPISQSDNPAEAAEEILDSIG